MVREATHKVTQKTYAVKMMTKACEAGSARLDPKFALRVHHEIDILQTLGARSACPPLQLPVSLLTH